MTDRQVGDHPPPPKKWIASEELVGAVIGAIVGGAIDAVIYWVIRPSTYLAVLGAVGAVVGIAMVTVMKSRRK